MQNNTTPEVRINKLGHAVTKHVLIQKPEAASLSSIPAPALQPRQSGNRADLSGFVSRAADPANYVQIFHKGDIAGDLSKRLEEFSDDTTRIIAESALNDREENGGDRTIFMFQVIMGADEKKVREVLTHARSLQNSTDTSDSVNLIKGLHQLEYFKEHPELESLDEKSHAVATAFLRVAEAVWDFAGGTHCEDARSDDKGLYINDKELADLIVEHYDKADLMVDYLADRMEVDVPQMREYVQTGALRDGVI